MLFDKQHVYFVESGEDATVRLGLAPSLDGDSMQWFDTLRPRRKRGKVVESSKDRLVYESVDGARYTFTVLTLDVYNARVRDAVELSPRFATDAELHAFYVRSFL